MVLFLLGLLTGLVSAGLTNPRMGLSAHLEGVMNGIFLLALGSAWPEVHLPRRWKQAAYWTALYGTYANWAVTSLGASFGTAALSPTTSAGHRGQPWQEALVFWGFITVAIATVAMSIIVILGLRRDPHR
jgi:(hydroxyamino)benzene mutase